MTTGVKKMNINSAVDWLLKQSIEVRRQDHAPGRACK
jgi:hypothetical protein